MKATRLILGFALAFAMSATSRANLLTNGDFSGGDTGFSSGYTFVPNNVENGSTGIISIGTTSEIVNPFWTDPTTVVVNNNTYSAVPVPGTTSFLFANGSTVASTPVWSETVTLAAGTQYAFSGYLAALYNQNPAALTISNQSGTILTTNAPSTPGAWNGFQNTFTTTTAGSYTFTIVDTNLQVTGNDFALSNLALEPGRSRTGQRGAVRRGPGWLWLGRPSPLPPPNRLTQITRIPLRPPSTGGCMYGLCRTTRPSRYAAAGSCSFADQTIRARVSVMVTRNLKIGSTPARVVEEKQQILPSDEDFRHT